MKQLLIPLLCSWTLLLYSCKQEPEPQLPPETQTGANTLGCMVNGKLWLPKGYNGSYPNLEADLSSKGTFFIGNYKVIGKSLSGNELVQRIPISIKGLTKIGTYNLETGKTEVIYNNQLNGCYYDNYFITSYFVGKVEITRFDLPNNIVSGRFEAILKAPNCDTIKITDGRFDVKPILY